MSDDRRMSAARVAELRTFAAEWAYNQVGINMNEAIDAIEAAEARLQPIEGDALAFLWETYNRNSSAAVALTRITGMMSEGAVGQLMAIAERGILTERARVDMADRAIASLQAQLEGSDSRNRAAVARAEAAESARDAWAHQCNLASEAQAVLSDVVGSVIVAGTLAPGEQWRPSREHAACDAVLRILARAEAAEARHQAHHDQLATIVDEAFGMQPVMPTDDLLTLLERKLYDDRSALREALRRAEAAEARAAEGASAAELLRRWGVAMLAENGAANRDELCSQIRASLALEGEVRVRAFALATPCPKHGATTPCALCAVEAGALAKEGGRG